MTFLKIQSGQNAAPKFSENGIFEFEIMRRWLYCYDTKILVVISGTIRFFEIFPHKFQIFFLSCKSSPAYNKRNKKELAIHFYIIDGPPAYT